MARYLLTLCLLFAGASLAQPPTEATAIETSKRFGDYEVHYSVFPSTMLNETVAAGYKIVRADNRAVLNISVRKLSGTSGDEAQRAVVSGSYSDLIQRKSLDFREIEEPGAVYYIAEFRHGDKELLRFAIDVQPDPAAAPFNLVFTRKLHHGR
jgi:hypothetical protein